MTDHKNRRSIMKTLINFLFGDVEEHLPPYTKNMNFRYLKDCELNAY